MSFSKRTKLNNRKKVLKMWEKNPHCHWCGRVTILSQYQEGKPAHLLTATYDHLYSRSNPERTKHNYLWAVLACYECNHEKGKAEFRALRAKEHKEKFEAKVKKEKEKRMHYNTEVSEVVVTTDSTGNTISWGLRAVPIEDTEIIEETITVRKRVKKSTDMDGKCFTNNKLFERPCAFENLPKEMIGKTINLYCGCPKCSIHC